MNHTSAVLLAKDISVQFTTEKGYVQAVKHISIEVHQGKITALIGQSGSGKSATAMAIAGILDSNGTMTSGEIYLQNQDISKLKGKALRAYRGKHLGMVFQEPMESLNPLLKIEEQIYQTLRLTQKLNKKQAKQKAIALLEQVGLPEPEKILKKYPFELSGGMCQRVMIAIAICLNPSLLIADEPTTALDVTVQCQILQQIQYMCKEYNMGVLFITHDLGIVAEIADDVYVMKNGEIVEYNNVFSLFSEPKHPYTKALLKAIPSLDLKEGERLQSIPGLPPSLIDPPKGCPFAERCEYATERCKNEKPEYTEFTETHRAMCFLNE